MYIYIHTWGFLFASMNGIDDGSWTVLSVHAIPSEARHARSDARRLVAANWTKHRLKRTHNTN